jgi:hypothetical protein
MNRYITPFIILILIVLISIIIFALIYHHLNKDSNNPYVNSWLNSFYTSVTIQTAVGFGSIVQENENDNIRIAYILQSLISYMITIGGIFLLFNLFFKKSKDFK